MRKDLDEVIDVSKFKGINIHFPGDVYLLAVWLVLSDRAQSTRIQQKHTMLQGLANMFSSLYGPNYSDPLSSDDVIAVLRKHGIKGNPALMFGDDEPPSTISLM